MATFHLAVLDNVEEFELVGGQADVAQRVGVAWEALVQGASVELIGVERKVLAVRNDRLRAQRIRQLSVRPEAQVARLAQCPREWVQHSPGVEFVGLFWVLFVQAASVQDGQVAVLAFDARPEARHARDAAFFILEAENAGVVAPLGHGAFGAQAALSVDQLSQRVAVPQRQARLSRILYRPASVSVNMIENSAMMHACWNLCHALHFFHVLKNTVSTC